ncbi:hypothetical protein HK105_205027 [Polyrhizophydium stewartii]|uniref:Pentatricopeptide repeat-containing protein n=1 Tax=Polyrhizophydium stewartii TaxID=2732419 RepID=A0ABR4N7B3_9FUNG
MRIKIAKSLAAARSPRATASVTGAAAAAKAPTARTVSSKPGTGQHGSEPGPARSQDADGDTDTSNQLLGLLTQHFFRHLDGPTKPRARLLDRPGKDLLPPAQHPRQQPARSTEHRPAGTTQASTSWDVYSELVDSALRTSSLSEFERHKLFGLVETTPADSPGSVNTKTAVLEAVIDKLGPHATSSQFMALASLLEKQSDLGRLVRLFNKLHSHGISGSPELYTILIRNLVTHGAVDSAAELFTCMRTSPGYALPGSHIKTPFGSLLLPVKPDLPSFLDSQGPSRASSKPAADSQQSLFYQKRAFPRPNTAAFEILAAGLCRAGEHKSVDALVHAMRLEPLPLSPGILVVLIDSFVRRRMFLAAVGAHRQLVERLTQTRRKRTQHPQPSDNPKGSVPTARKQFVPPNLAYLKNACVALCHTRHIDEALDLVAAFAEKQALVDQGTHPGAAIPPQIYKFMISHSTKSMQIDEAFSVLAHARSLYGASSLAFLDLASSSMTVAHALQRHDLAAQLLESMGSPELAVLCTNPNVRRIVLEMQSLRTDEHILATLLSAAVSSDPDSVERSDLANELAGKLASAGHANVVAKIVGDIVNGAETPEQADRVHERVSAPLVSTLILQGHGDAAWRVLNAAVMLEEGSQDHWTRLRSSKVYSDTVVPLALCVCDEEHVEASLHAVHILTEALGHRSKASDAVALHFARHSSAPDRALGLLMQLPLWDPTVSGLIDAVDALCSRGMAQAARTLSDSLDSSSSAAAGLQQRIIRTRLDFNAYSASAQPEAPNGDNSPPPVAFVPISQLQESQVAAAQAWAAGAPGRGGVPVDGI